MMLEPKCSEIECKLQRIAKRRAARNLSRLFAGCGGSATLALVTAGRAPFDARALHAKRASASMITTARPAADFFFDRLRKLWWATL